MNRIYLHRDDLKEILQFLDTLNANTVEVTCSNDSGIGADIKARVNEVDLHGLIVTVEKVIVSEEDW